MFWILTILLIALALVFLLPPLLKKPKKLVDDRRELNIDIARQQLKELETEFKEGNIEEDAYESAKSELEQALYSDLEATDAAVNTSGSDMQAKETKFATLFTMVFVPALAIGLYSIIGNPKAIAESSVDRNNPTEMSREQAVGSISSMLSTLEDKLKKEPKNVKGWVMLGRSYMALERPDDAIKAYSKANELDPDNPNIMLPLADTLATVNKGDLTGKPEALILKSLKKEPDNIMAIWLAGMAAKQRGVDAEAVKYWKKLEPMLDPRSTDRKEVRNLIKEAGGTLEPLPEMAAAPMAMPNAPAGKAPAADPANAGKGITVTVDISDELKAKAKPEDIVFIYAKAMSGPPMPLAAQRKQVKDLPLTLVLDDSTAMMPQMKLSNFADVKVGARVSFSGQPSAQAGDLFVEKLSVKKGAKLELTINGIVGEKPRKATAAPATPSAAVAPVAQAQQPSESASTATAATSHAGISVTISLSDELKAKAKPEDTVFIYAKAMSGPPMPLAAQRKQVKDLPITLMLDDSTAMMPQMKLSSFPEVKVGARVSFTGRPMAQPGDLYTETLSVKAGAKLDLVIDKVVGQ